MLCLTTHLLATANAGAVPAKDAWPWGMRAATFYCPPRLKVSDAELEDRVGLLARLGYDTLVIEGEHFRLDFFTLWPEIEALNARIAAVAHRHGLKAMDHHSAGAIHTDHFEDAWGSHRLRELNPVNWKTGKEDIYIETLVFICPNNPLHWEVYSQHARRLMVDARVDAIMADDVEMLLDTYTCACSHCRAGFRERYGLGLPPADDRAFWGNRDNAGFRKWLRFRQESVGGFHRRMRKLRDEVAPHVKLLACHCDPGGISLPVVWGAAHDEWEPSLDILFLEAMGSLGYFEDWAHHATDMKLLQAMGHGRKPVFPLYYAQSAGNPSVVLFSGPESLERLRPNGLYSNSVGKLTGAYERAAYADPQDHPGRDEFLFTWALSRMFADGYWVGANYDLGTEGILFEKQHAELRDRPESIASVAVHYSRQARDFLGLSESLHVAEWRGWAMALLQGNVPFDVVVDEDLEKPLPRRVRLLILPNSACLSDGQAAQIRRFVARGGHVIATGDTSLYTADGTRRPDFALAGVLGIHHVETKRGVSAEATWLGGPGLRARVPSPLPVADDLTIVRLSSGAKALGRVQAPGLEVPLGAEAASGKVLYLAAKPGLLGGPQRARYIEKGKVEAIAPRVPGWAAALQAVIRESLRAAGGPPVRLAHAPRGVIAASARSGARTVVQILNAVGGIRQPGEVYDPNNVAFPQVRPDGGPLQLRVHSSRRPARVTLLSPDVRESLPLAAKKEGGEWTVELPPDAVRRYAVVVWE